MTGALQVELVDYGMNSVSQGIDAMAITRVVIRPVLSCSGVTPQVGTLAILILYIACCVFQRTFTTGVLRCCASGLLACSSDLTRQVSSPQLSLLDSDKLTSSQATRQTLV